MFAHFVLFFVISADLSCYYLLISGVILLLFGFLGCICLKNDPGLPEDICAPHLSLKVHVGYSRPRCLPMAVQTVTHVCAGVDGTCVDRPDTLKAGGAGSRVLVIKTFADPDLSAPAVMAAVTEIPSWAVFAPGLTRARVVNTGPVDPSANVGDGLNGRGQAPGPAAARVVRSNMDPVRKYAALWPVAEQVQHHRVPLVPSSTFVLGSTGPVLIVLTLSKPGAKAAACSSSKHWLIPSCLRMRCDGGRDQDSDEGWVRPGPHKGQGHQHRSRRSQRKRG